MAAVGSARLNCHQGRMHASRQALLAAALWLDGARVSLRADARADLESLIGRGVGSWGIGAKEKRNCWQLKCNTDPRPPIPLQDVVYAAFGNEAGVTIGVSALRRTHQVSWMPIANASPRTQRPRTTTMPTKSGAKSAVMSRVPVGIAESDGTCENILSASLQKM